MHSALATQLALADALPDKLRREASFTATLKLRVQADRPTCRKRRKSLCCRLLGSTTPSRFWLGQALKVNVSRVNICKLFGTLTCQSFELK